VPGNLTAPARGAVVDVPVVPTPNCRPWSAPGAMNPGPHSGAVTIREQVGANTGPAVAVTFSVGATAVRITQAADLPAPPVLHAAVDRDRVHLSWEPGVGAGITSFEIRGAALGAALTTVATLSGSLREWTSPPLASGSYVVQAAARNDLGAGPASNEVRFSIGVRTAPDAPDGLLATVVDDQVTLVWTPPGTGPAPSGYVVEAAPASTDSFVAVARTADPRLSVIRVPVGPWRVRVRAATDGGIGPPSAPVTVAPVACTAAPGAPEAPWPLGTYPSFTLRWSAPAVGSVEQYVIDVGSVAGASDIGHVLIGGDQTTVTVPLVSARAFARVRARNACGQSTPSPEVLVALGVSASTRATIAGASEAPQAMALALGSPEFQRR